MIGWATLYYCRKPKNLKGYKTYCVRAEGLNFYLESEKETTDWVNEEQEYVKNEVA